MKISTKRCEYELYTYSHKQTHICNWENMCLKFLEFETLSYSGLVLNFRNFLISFSGRFVYFRVLFTLSVKLMCLFFLSQRTSRVICYIWSSLEKIKSFPTHSYISNTWTNLNSWELKHKLHHFAGTTCSREAQNESKEIWYLRTDFKHFPISVS